MPARHLFVQTPPPPKFNVNPTYRLVANPRLRTDGRGLPHQSFFVLCKESLTLVVLNLEVERSFLHLKYSRILKPETVLN
jgi:hypothetical protein